MPTETARSIMKEAQRRREDRRPDPRVQGFSGSYRFDVEGVGSWRVEVHDEIATMTESTAAADCVFRCNEADFVRIARGSRTSSPPSYKVAFRPRATTRWLSGGTA